MRISRKPEYYIARVHPAFQALLRARLQYVQVSHLIGMRMLNAKMGYDQLMGIVNLCTQSILTIDAHKNTHQTWCII